jgi:hypothetical protein
MWDWSIGIVLALATVLVHGFGTWGLVALMGPRLRMHWHRASVFHHQWLLARVVVFLFLLHVAEAGIWAVFYLQSGALPDGNTALYFSLCSYTTVGYGDVVLGPEWRLLGAFESCVGVLMMGWSTGILVAMVMRQFDAKPPPPRAAEGKGG